MQWYWERIAKLPWLIQNTPNMENQLGDVALELSKFYSCKLDSELKRRFTEINGAVPTKQEFLDNVPKRYTTPNSGELLSWKGYILLHAQILWNPKVQVVFHDFWIEDTEANRMELIQQYYA